MVFAVVHFLKGIDSWVISLVHNQWLKGWLINYNFLMEGSGCSWQICMPATALLIHGVNEWQPLSTFFSVAAGKQPKFPAQGILCTAFLGMLATCFHWWQTKPLLPKAGVVIGRVTTYTKVWAVGCKLIILELHFCWHEQVLSWPGLCKEALEVDIDLICI